MSLQLSTLTPALHLHQCSQLFISGTEVPSRCSQVITSGSQVVQSGSKVVTGEVQVLIQRPLSALPHWHHGRLKDDSQGSSSIITTEPAAAVQQVQLKVQQLRGTAALAC
jgi:hypothetical protein